MSESKFKTMRHIETVRNFIGACIKELINRQELHDQSKLESPEVEIFEVFTPKLRGCTYGSDEYKSFMTEMNVAIKHHNEANRHHPEHFSMRKCCVCGYFGRDSEGFRPTPENVLCPKCCEHGAIYECQFEETSGFYGMTLIDLLELICDWKSATLRHADGDIYKSLEINQKRFGYSDDLKQILKNTVEWIHSETVFHQAQES